MSGSAPYGKCVMCGEEKQVKILYLEAKHNHKSGTIYYCHECGVDFGKISDGYHTFDELYDHRIRLYIELCRAVAEKKYVWCSELHSDGSRFDGWFVLGIGEKQGEQITYHLPMEYIQEVSEFADVLTCAPEWDNHTSDDVLKRLKGKGETYMYGELDGKDAEFFRNWMGFFSFTTLILVISHYAGC